MYIWQQAGGRRHGRIGDTNGCLATGRVFRSLCGLELTVEKRDDRTLAGAVWLDTTCSACDYVMRRENNAPAHAPDYVHALTAARIATHG
jgi:hypothetical protein